MTKNYFAIERNGKCIVPVVLKDANGKIAFEDVMQMSYEDIKKYQDIDAFVVNIMDATNEQLQENDDDTFVTLVGEDDVFIWGILIGPGDNNDEFLYKFVNWKENGKSYRYEKN